MFLTALVNPAFFFAYISIIIISIVVHELAHGFAAINQGDDTPIISGHITLNPVVHMGIHSLIFLCIAGIAWGEMPVNPRKFRSPKYSHIIVSAAGPLSNLALAFLFIGFLKIAGNGSFDAFLSTNILYMAARINIILFLFNLLPIPPLDGYSVFRDFFPGLRQLEHNQMGMFLLMVIFLVPGFSQFFRQVADLLIALIM
jgi:Zn-dependent protease